ncbi:LysR family transcriptional regulator [Paraburkholderia sp. NPDC080076]|jgi:DNA-binding transcriptional LysR family regulator|uniref:LysR family transcriptional regulator n=1 Tax=Paraburkholderia sp. NPDC080076 TaxID=3390605 RepID=UPI003D07F8CC
MNIQQLETFYWITRLGTFAAAGEYLHTSQANVSSRIRELESELDVLLFERIGRTVTLTLKGRELLSHAERVVAEAARLRVAAGKLVVGQGLVRIGVGEVIAMRSLITIINRLKERYPGLDVEFDVNLNANLLSKLERGSIDIAVVGGPVDDPDTKLVPIGAMNFVWVGAPSLLGDLMSARPRDLATLPIISLSRDARTFSVMQGWFADGAATPTTINYCNSLSTMLNVVRAGICICMMPFDLVTADLEAGTLRVVSANPPLRPLPFFVATRAESIDPAVADIAQIVVDVTRLPSIDTQEA